METKEKLGKTLQNERTPNRREKPLPSGTFTKNGEPTTVLDLIGLKVVDNELSGVPRDKINSTQFQKEVVDLIDHLKLFSAGLTTEKKMSSVGQQISWMLTTQETIKTGNSHAYNACKKAYRKAKDQFKISGNF